MARHTDYVVMSRSPTPGMADTGAWSSHYGRGAKREACDLARRIGARVYRRTSVFEEARLVSETLRWVNLYPKET